MDKLTAMQVFKEVATTQNFSLAAESLNMSRAKVTRYINELEDWLKCRLFYRSTRNVTLTVAGEEHLKEAKIILALTNTFQSLSSNKTQKPCGKIRVSTSVAFGDAHIASLLVDYLKSYPEVEIELIVTDECLNLIESRIDLAIRTSVSADENLIARPLSSSKAILCAAPSYLAQAPQIKSPYDLKNHQLLLCTSFKPYTKWTFSKGTNVINLEVGSNLVSNDILILSRAAVAGGGIVRLPCFLAKPLIREGKLTQVLPEWHIFELNIWAVYICREHQPASIRSLIDFMVDYFEAERAQLRIVK